MALERFWEDLRGEILNNQPDLPPESLEVLRYTMYIGAGAAMTLVVNKEATFEKLGREVKAVIAQMNKPIEEEEEGEQKNHNDQDETGG